MEKHISGFRKSLETHKDKIRELDGESIEWKHRAEGEKKKFNEVRLFVYIFIRIHVLTNYFLEDGLCVAGAGQAD